MINSNSEGSTEEITLVAARKEFVAEKKGNYGSNLEYILKKWTDDWLDGRDEETLADVTPLTMRHYASYLERRARGDTGIAESTARTYYNYVSALLSWAVKVEYLPENPAEKERAKGPLPSATTSSSDQQFWTPEQRQAITDYVDERARAAIDTDGTAAFEEVRDRALVYVLAYTGVRGAEVLADRRVDRRNGLRWSDVDFENGIIEVFGKSQDREEVGLTGQTIGPLQRLRTLVDPPAESWPVFPSRHPPSLYDRIDTSEHDRPDGNPLAFVFEHEIEPPSMSTSGTRTLLKRLSKEAKVPGLDVDDGEYLTLHGARRGVGETLYKEHGAQRAQRTLRHADPKTTSEMYSHIEASELGEDNTSVFENE
ncbi:tyrosine-type recombinase/integrase [Natrinema soli]|uniref:Tyrosine-type recombinase/integrase n=1 Tax=Natrinema soli TaxID=1930624 RepID=A0ABD5SXD2_9EURY|nr:site-specific integrase [Natrinema soli]